MSESKPPKPILPGEIILEELEAREWLQVDLAHITGLGTTIISDIVNGKRDISLKYAEALADAFGTSEELWLRLQHDYDLASAEPRDGVVTRRARLYDKAPIREMQKRKWIEDTKDIGRIETDLCKFFHIKSIEEALDFEHAARKSDDYNSKVSPTQAAWLRRAKNLAPTVPVDRRYSNSHFDRLMDELAQLTEEPEEIRHVPRVLAGYGVRFLVVEPLPRTKIDGACFWLDDQAPIVVLSLRHNRIDNFWQSLCHELKHIRDGEGRMQAIVETSIVGSDAQPFDTKPPEEQAADTFAAGFLIDQGEIEDFIVRTAPYFSRDKVLGFALRMKVHPGIVVGQLQYRRALEYSHFRKLLIEVQQIVTRSSLTDGWGHVA